MRSGQSEDGFFDLLQPLLPLLLGHLLEVLQPVSAGGRLDGEDEEDEVEKETDKEQQPRQDRVDLHIAFYDILFDGQH